MPAAAQRRNRKEAPGPLPERSGRRKFKVEAPFAPAGDQVSAIRLLSEGLETGLHSQTLLGVTGSGKTYTIAKVVERVQRPTLVMAPNKTLAAQLYGEFRQFFPRNAIEYFVSYYDYYQPEAYVPSSDTYIEKDASINEHIEQMRLSATKALLERKDALVVATVSAIYGIGAPESYLKMRLHLVRGEEIDRQQALRRLAELQYVRNDMEFQRGTYRVRGEVIDIFPAESAEAAIRLTLFDRELERIEFFDPLTGEVLRAVPRVTVHPRTHYVTPRDQLLATLEQIEKDLKKRLAELKAADKLLEAQRLEQRTRFDLEMIRELGYCTGIENYSRYLSGRAPGEPPPTLFDYLPQDALVVIDESHVTAPQIGGMYRGDRSRKETLVEYGFRLPSALDNRPLRFDEWEAGLNQAIFVSATPSRYELERADQVVEQVVRPTGLTDPQVEVRPVEGQVDDLMSEIRLRAGKSERTLVTTLTKRMAEDLSEYLDEHGVRVRYLHSDINTVERVEIIRDLRLGAFDALVGINLLREGLDMPEVSLVAILDADREGYLRSESSLIQTMGRAARNVNGAVILYAERVTDSMRRAMDETGRRRDKQLAYNKKRGIRPRTVRREVADIMEGAQTAPGRAGKRGAGKRRAALAGGAVADDAARLATLSAKDLGREIRRLESAMYEHAANLEFEEAARLRDTIAEVRERAFADPR